MKNKKPEAEHKVVMLIDDNELDNFVNQKIMEANNFSERYYTNSSGKSAIEFLQNILIFPDFENMLPSIIFIDINMPIMNGFQFIEKLESILSASLDKIKLVILSTSLDSEDKKKAMKFKNEVLFFHKPLTEATLALLKKQN